MSLTHRMMLSVVLLLALLFPLKTEALKHSFAVKKDSRLFIAPIGAPFGFLQGGCFGLDVFDFGLTMSMKKKKKSQPQQGLDNVQAGLLLKRFESESDFATYQDTITSNATLCIFDPFRSNDEDLFEDGNDDLGEVSDITTAGTDGIFIPLRNDAPTANISMYQFKQGEDGLYFLMYQVCSKDSSSDVHARIRTTFELDFHYKNYDFLGNENHLPAGETQLPHVFMYFSISYAILLGLWVSNIRKIQSGLMDGPMGRPRIYPIHQLMTVLLILKTLSVFFESVRYHYIRVSGHAELWSVVYYTFAFLKGTFLFTVILLIGSGWSFVKPFLSNREKKVICLVLTLQVIDNIALVALSHEAEGERAYDNWSAVLHLVDILCCCAVLVPLVWQVNALEKSLEGPDGGDAVPSTADEARTLSKLMLFRSFYLTVVAYIYFTRILIYVFATMLDYRHTWIRYFIAELVTLLFYVVTGMRFRPMTENPYLSVDDKDESTAPMIDPEHEIEFGTVEGEGSGVDLTI